MGEATKEPFTPVVEEICTGSKYPNVFQFLKSIHWPRVLFISSSLIQYYWTLSISLMIWAPDGIPRWASNVDSWCLLTAGCMIHYSTCINTSFFFQQSVVPYANLSTWFIQAAKTHMYSHQELLFWLNYRSGHPDTCLFRWSQTTTLGKGIYLLKHLISKKPGYLETLLWWTKPLFTSWGLNPRRSATFWLDLVVTRKLCLAYLNGAWYSHTHCIAAMSAVNFFSSCLK